MFNQVKVLLTVGIFLSAQASRAEAPLSPEEAVKVLIDAVHGISAMSGKRVMETWEEVQRNPRPYLPVLKAGISMERIEAEQDSTQLETTLRYVLLYARLGGTEEREFVASLYKTLQLRRERIDTQVQRQELESAAAPSPAKEEALLKSRLRRNRIQQAMYDIVDVFTSVGDPRLCTALLVHLDNPSERFTLGRYIQYFEAACRENPVVQARLKKLSETTESQTTKRALQHFFTK